MTPDDLNYIPPKSEKTQDERDVMIAALRFLVYALDNDQSTVLSLQHAKFLLRRYPRKK